jgi:hypothetical protein
MIIIPITNEQRVRANELYDFKILNNSITSGKSNIYGAIGEIVVYDFYKKKEAKIDNQATYHYDLIINDFKPTETNLIDLCKHKDGLLKMVILKNICAIDEDKGFLY